MHCVWTRTRSNLIQQLLALKGVLYVHIKKKLCPYYNEGTLASGLFTAAQPSTLLPTGHGPAPELSSLRNTACTVNTSATLLVRCETNFSSPQESDAQSGRPEPPNNDGEI
jgi:hypothetical protein